MKSRRTKSRVQRIRVYTHEGACQALPYIASIVRSLREHRLDALAHDRAARFIDARPGRPDRDTILAREAAVEDARLAHERFEEALEELNALDVYCLDPVRGQAMVPFVHGEHLAWYIYDQFEGEELRSWRFHADPLETRRPIAELQPAPVALAGPVV